MRKRGAHFKGKHKPVDHAAWQNTIAMKHRMQTDQLDDIGWAIHGAVERMRNGCGTDRDWNDLVAIVDVSLILCEWGVGAEHLDAIRTAQDALVEIHHIHTRTGAWGFHGAGYVAITHAVGIHEAQIAAIPRETARNAMREAMRRAASGHVLEVAA